MFEKIKKRMPAYMVFVGIIISLIFILLSRFTGPGYESLIMSEFMQEAAMVILSECLAAAAAFKILTRKAKL